MLIAAVDESGIFDAHAHLRLPASGIAHLIVGRHERCDVVLSRDTDVSLRHLLVRATPRLRAARLPSPGDRSALPGRAAREDGKRCEAIAAKARSFCDRELYGHAPSTGPAMRPWTADADSTWADLAPRSRRSFLRRSRSNRAPRRRRAR